MAEEEKRFQGFLDETFPRGAWVVTITRDEGIAAGIEMVTGRLMVQECRIVNGEWLRWLVIDPMIRPITEFTDTYEKPFEPWIAGSLVESETMPGVWEAEIVTEQRNALGTPEVLRINTNAMVGDRKPLPGSRGWVTEKWEDFLFPHGLDVGVVEQEVEIDA